MAKLFVPLRAVLVLTAAGLTGCATPGPILGHDVAVIRAGIAATRDTAQSSFASANAFVRDQAVDRLVDKPAEILSAEQFPRAVSAIDAAAWNTAFGALDRYSAALQRLVDPKRAQATGDALTALGTELQSGVFRAKLPTEVSALFATFGAALVQARAERKAMLVMRDVDPSFNAVTSGMADAIGADAIGADASAHLRGTLHSAWQTQLTVIDGTYKQANPADRVGRRALIVRYRDALDQRDAQDDGLAQLNASLLALGSAHAAAARGNSGDAQFWLDRIDGWLSDVKRRAAILEKGRPGA